MIVWLLLLVSGTEYPEIRDTKMSLQANGGWGNTHEKTHGVNSALRNSVGGDCFYLMWGRYVQFEKCRSPRIGQVASQVKMRGGVYNLYLVQQRRYWDDTPLYLFDELVSYTNGTVDAWNQKRGDNHATLQYAVEFQHYTAVLVLMIPDSYADKREVARFWIWNYDRLKTVIDYYNQQPVSCFRMADKSWIEQIAQDRSRILSWLSSQ